MRLSVALVIFLVLLNGWSALLIDYDIDDHLGISAETGETPDGISKAEQAAQDRNYGQSGGITDSLIGPVIASAGTLNTILAGATPAGQMLANILPSGIIQAIVIWALNIIYFIVVIDLLNFVRGVG